MTQICTEERPCLPCYLDNGDCDSPRVAHLEWQRLLLTIGEDYWRLAFATAREAKIIKANVYHIPTDTDCLFMYCMGNEL